MQTRNFDEMISYFNRKVSDMYIDRKYKMELLAMITAIGMAHEKELDAQQEQRWIPSGKKPPEKGSYLVWMPFAPSKHRMTVSEYCGGYWNIKTPISAWMPLPEPYKEGTDD